MSKRPRHHWSKKTARRNTSSDNVKREAQANLDVFDKSNPHYFQLKGKCAEDIIHQLAEKTFFKDWCFPNPFVKKGKELCDLLVVFDNIAIIWQVKDLEIRSDGTCSQGELDKNLRQLGGARRQLFDLKTTITLLDGHGHDESFDADAIQHIYLISVLTGPEQDYYSPLEQIKKYKAHVYSGRTLEILLNELDTISDFYAYLKAKEALFDSEMSIIISGGEEELLGFYLLEDRSFDKFSSYDSAYLTGDFWEGYKNRKEVIAKNSEDRISYVWDNLIKVAATTGYNYKRITREMAKLCRFKRRAAAKSVIELVIRASKDKSNNIFRRNFNVDNVTYTLLLMPSDWNREVRKKVLMAQYLIARDMSENCIVIGLATELERNVHRSFDFCYINYPEWDDDQRAHAQELKKAYKIWENPEYYHYHEDEYPQV